MYNYVQIIFTSFAIISEILSTKVTSEFRRETIENDYFPPKYFCQYKFKNRKIDLIYKPFPNKQYLRFWGRKIHLFHKIPIPLQISLAKSQCYVYT